MFTSFILTLNCVFLCTYLCTYHHTIYITSHHHIYITRFHKRRLIVYRDISDSVSPLITREQTIRSFFGPRFSSTLLCMPLMTDPSVIYGLELQHQWRGTLYESDLKRDTPYNTYVHAGLPPGPVANPGVKALRAAIEPARTDYLYFVAAGDNPQGKSVFAATLEEHNRNVADYRQAMKKAGGR